MNLAPPLYQEGEPEICIMFFLQAYYEAGADFAETNTFSGTSIAQADYGMGEVVSKVTTFLRL